MKQENQQSQLKHLIAKGKEQGFLTYSEVNDHLPSDIVDPDQVEDIIGMINDMGIKVHETAPDVDSLITDSAIVSDDDDDAAEVAAAALASVDNEFGRTTDPVRMYMREMGTVELLTRQGELKIAKRIEEGQIQVLSAMARCPQVIEFFLAASDRVAQEEVRVTDLISDFIDPNLPEYEISSPAAPKVDEETEEEEFGLDPNELKEKAALLRKRYKTLTNALKKYGYHHDRTQKAYDTLTDSFLEFKWTPNFFKALADRLHNAIREVRKREKIILDICVRKAKMPRKEFIKAFTQNETNIEWIQPYLNKTED